MTTIKACFVDTAPVSNKELVSNAYYCDINISDSEIIIDYFSTVAKKHLGTRVLKLENLTTEKESFKVMFTNVSVLYLRDGNDAVTIFFNTSSPPQKIIELENTILAAKYALNPAVAPQYNAPAYAQQTHAQPHAYAPASPAYVPNSTPVYQQHPTQGYYQQTPVYSQTPVYQQTPNPWYTTPVNTQPKPSATEEIKKYKELLDMGAITQEDYDRKKNELLGF